MSKQSVVAKSGRAAGKVRNWVRRQIIVNPSFQYRMLLPIGMFVLVEVLLLAGFLIYPLHRNAGMDPNPVVQALLSEQALGLHVKLWPLIGISAVIASLYTLLRSRRVAGPLYRLQQGLEGMAVGKIERLQFRQGDEFREFEGVAHRLARRMETLSTGKTNRLSRIESRIARLDVRLETEDIPKETLRRELQGVLADFSRP